MSNAKHTALPWKRNKVNNTMIDSAHGKTVGTVNEVFTSKEEAEANIELIIKAVNSHHDFVEVCELLLKHANNILPPAEGAYFEDAHDIVTKAREALKKAKTDGEK